MDLLFVLVGAVVLVVSVCGGTLGLLAWLVQRVERRSPDPTLPRLGHFVRPGCEFDRQKHLACRVRLAHRRMEDAQQRYRDLHACLYPDPILREAAIRAGLVPWPRREFTVNSAFYHGQVRAAQRRLQ